MLDKKRYAYERLKSCKPVDEKALLEHEKYFRENTLPKLEKLQKAKELSASRAMSMPFISDLPV